MKIRRLLMLALLLLGLAAWPSAIADAAVSLDVIGVRYTPVQGERYVTRDAMAPDALAAFGADGSVLLDAMTRDGIFLISLQPDGRQYTLGVSAMPDGLACQNAAGMSAADKDAFLAQLARQGGYGQAQWETDGYALFSSKAEAQADAALTYSDLSLSTLYLGQVYTFRMDLIGREATQADVDLLLNAAQRTLRLGASTRASDDTAATPQALALPDTTVDSEPAALTYDQQTCPLTLDPIPATVGVTRLTLSGTTVPSGYLRYTLNGRSSSRIKADETGAFSFSVPSLTGNADNAITLTAFQDDLKTVVRFTVAVQWQTAPLALETVDTVAAQSVTLRGLALAGSTVRLTQGRGSERIAVADDGQFSVQLMLGRAGANAFTLQVQADGFRRNDYSFSINRAVSQADQLAELQRKARAVEYQRVLSRTSAYEGKVVQLSGIASALSYGDGEPRFTLTTDAAEAYAVRCADLLGVQEGEPITLLGTLTGALTEDSGYPVLTLAALLPTGN